ncbi:PTS sugar transporter subunit IIA [Devosia sp.]|uniref:PTS sugar transporter subunit IIA n=1 Tax=Devosia sp. TaxID=1871048 RepID=UPI002AFFB767|nr:PTS sugar transporter subunit IIA [Devosia sp.]
MNVADLLEQNGVLILDRQKDKLSLLTLMAEHAGRALQLDAHMVADAVSNREDLGSTGLGSGVAIPHARIAEVPYALGVLALLREPLDYDAIDDEPVDIVFMLIMPATPAALEILAGVARTFRQQDLTIAC